MNENEFWDLIETSKLESRGLLVGQQVELLQLALERKSEREILDFDRLLHQQMGRSYTRELWAAAYIINGGCSDDGFDYFRAWLIAQGREIFQNALLDPESLTDVASSDAELELLLYVAAKAYEAKTNAKFPRPTHPKAELSGAEWEEDEEALKAKFPQLFMRFWSSDAEEGRRDDEQAARRYRQGAEQGNADDCAALADLYRQGLGVEQNYQQAFKWYQKGASLGSPYCEYGLGLLYAGGLGAGKNLHEAFNWFQQAAQGGHEGAAFHLGLAYLKGQGVEPDATQAVRWFTQAADRGSVQARYNVGLLYAQGRGVRQDFAKAAEMYQLAAERGQANAMLNLGVLYGSGKGVPQDYAKAAAWYRRATDAGNLVALNNLAVLYQHGRGVPQDQAEAVRLYRKCADAGIAAGQFNLARMYRDGTGVSKDDQEALRFHHLAAAQDFAPAMNNIGDAYENGYGVQRDYAKAAEWYRKAAERGVAASHYSLGAFYRDGLGVEQNFQEAEKWLKIAVEKGYEKGGPALAAFYAAGHVQPTSSETMSRNQRAAGKVEPLPVEKLAKAKDYQLVLQFLGDSLADFDAMASLEHELTEQLGDSGNVDGHDIGSGEVNIFIFTSDPGAAFQRVKPVLERRGQMQAVTAAYREVEGERYTVIWPEGSRTNFRVL